jgi:hypothetical protein
VQGHIDEFATRLGSELTTLCLGNFIPEFGVVKRLMDRAHRMLGLSFITYLSLMTAVKLPKKRPGNPPLQRLKIPNPSYRASEMAMPYVEDAFNLLGRAVKGLQTEASDHVNGGYKEINMVMVRAAVELLNRAFGKPPVSVEILGRGAQKHQHLHLHATLPALANELKKRGVMLNADDMNKLPDPGQYVDDDTSIDNAGEEYEDMADARQARNHRER